MPETIFAKIISREIPAHIVYEDDMVLAFLDINPTNHGHTLIIPKKHFINIFDGDNETLTHMMKVAKKVALALKKADLAEGVNLIMNNGPEAGQEVWHAHLHVVPRLNGDKVFHKPNHVTNPEAEFSTVQEKLIKALVN